MLDAVIAAGGKSRRMGTDKRKLVLGGQTILERIVTRLEPIVNAVHVVLESEKEGRAEKREPILTSSFLQNHHVKIINDKHGNRGPAAGVAAGLEACAASGAQYALVTAADMPFVSRSLAFRLYETCKLDPSCGVALPLYDGRLHPLFAVYRVSALSVFQRFLESGCTKLLDAVDLLHARIIELSDQNDDQISPEWALFNMNTPDEYEKAIARESMEL